MGTVYKRGGKIWWIKYYKEGKPYYESSKSTKKAVAEQLLKLREGSIAEGRFVGLQVEKTTFEDLVQDYINDYKINNRKSLRTAKTNIRVLNKLFGGLKAKNITSDKIQQYILMRLENGITNDSINRELASLKRMMVLGERQTPKKVVNIPHIQKLKSNNPRMGFFEHTEYLKLKETLPEYFKTVLVLAYHTGMRKEEILSLKKSQVNLLKKTITLEVGKTKNDQSRIIYLEGELLDSIEKQMESISIKCPYVFHIKGKRIIDFRRSWNTACHKAGIGHKIFHDLRRTAVRNMIRAGIPEGISMRISGHKTRMVFERYNITSERDLKEASKKITNYHNREKELQNSYNSKLIKIKKYNDK